MAITFQIDTAITAEEFERRGGEWQPHTHWIVPTHDEIVAEFVQSLLDKYAADVQAYAVSRILDGDTYCVELQFHDDAIGEHCDREYKRGFSKGGVVPKQKQARSKKTKKRLYSHRMYRLPDGELFFYFAKWDGHGNLVGKVYDEIEDNLRNKIVHRSVLEESVLIPKGEEPWVLG